MSKKLSPSTIEQYKFIIDKFSDLDFNDPEATIKYLFKQTTVREEKKISLTYVKKAISAILWYLREEKVDKSIISKYTSEVSKLLEETEKQELDHTRNAENIPEWSDIVAKRDELLANGKHKDHLILSLYTYIAPRRLKDFQMMKVVKNDKLAVNKEFNYYIMGTNRMLFYIYKTQKYYEKQEIIIPNELKDIIMKYIEFAQLSSGARFFNNKTHHVLHHILIRLLGCGVDAIRHSFINNCYNTQKMPDSEYMEDMAKSMGHSLQTHLRYRKQKITTI